MLRFLKSVSIRVFAIEDIYLAIWLNCILYIQMYMTRINKHSGHKSCYILYTLNDHVDLIVEQTRAQKSPL